MLGENPSCLIGNGLSINFDKSFLYSNLLVKAAEHGLSQASQEVFNRLGTRNFEEVMRWLDGAAFIAEEFSCTCGAPVRIRHGTEETKAKLIESISDVHSSYAKSTSVPDSKKAACVDFLLPFRRVYTLNYDFLLYWTWIHGVYSLRKIKSGDGFRYSSFVGLDDDGIRFLHGALHLYTENGALRKYTYRSSDSKTLLDQVLMGFKKHRYPLFISEGDSNKKLTGIRQSYYLSACFAEFGATGPGLITYGTQFGTTDRHLVDAIANNRNLNILLIGSQEWPPNSLQSVATTIENERKRLGRTPLTAISIYRQDTICPWGP